MNSTEKKTPAQIQDALSGYYGTENYYRAPLTRQMVYTDGVKAMADMCGAYWLIDAIVSWQAKCRTDAMLRDIQFWTLRKNDKGNGAVLNCERDTNDSAFYQEIAYTDFPLSEIKLMVEHGSVDGVNEIWVLMLPSER